MPTAFPKKLAEIRKISGKKTFALLLIESNLIFHLLLFSHIERSRHIKTVLDYARTDNPNTW